MTGNNVSHANNKTRRRFLPNLQEVSLYSETLERSFSMRISQAGRRTVEHKGGLDKYLMSTGASKLAPELRKIRKLVEKSLAEKEKAA